MCISISFLISNPQDSVLHIYHYLKPFTIRFTCKIRYSICGTRPQCFFHSIAVPLVATTKPTSCGREKKHQDVRGGSVTWSERTSETQLFVARLELKLDSNLTNRTSCCFSMWSKRTTFPLADGSWWPQEVIHAISADAWERIVLLFGRISYVMHLKEWHSRIWIKPAFQGYCFYFSTCTCLFFPFFFVFCHLLCDYIMFACLVGPDKRATVVCACSYWHEHPCDLHMWLCVCI